MVGLDSSLFAGCTFGREPAAVETMVMDVRNVGVDDLRGFDAVAYLAAISNDPLGNLNPPVHLRHQPSGLYAAGADGQASRGDPVRVLLLVQPVRSGGDDRFLDE